MNIYECTMRLLFIFRRFPSFGICYKKNIFILIGETKHTYLQASLLCSWLLPIDHNNVFIPNYFLVNIKRLVLSEFFSTATKGHLGEYLMFITI